VEQKTTSLFQLNGKRNSGSNVSASTEEARHTTS